ncbi:uncharacterized protein LOC106998205 [Macaca mulatta]
MPTELDPEVHGLNIYHLLIVTDEMMFFLGCSQIDVLQVVTLDRIGFFGEMQHRTCFDFVHAECLVQVPDELRSFAGNDEWQSLLETGSCEATGTCPEAGT